MTPMRTVSACALARRQSRVIAAVTAAEFFSSDLREIFIVSLPDTQADVACCYSVVRTSIWGRNWKVNAPFAYDAESMPLMGSRFSSYSALRPY